MFGRRSTQDPAPAEATAVKDGGKGRPTPRRRDAESRNRHPVVGAATVRSDATKAERKAARKARREQASAERALTQRAMVTGEERYLPARDRGPARRFARDYVDARRGLAEFFLPTAIVVLVLSMIPVVWVKAVAAVLLYAMIAAVAVEAFLLRRRLNRMLSEKFGDERSRGAATYGMSRSLQMRRTRLPRPQVGRGEFPV